MDRLYIRITLPKFSLVPGTSFRYRGEKPSISNKSINLAVDVS